MFFITDELMAEVNSELEPGESIIDYCEWEYSTPWIDPVTKRPSVYALFVLTESNFYIFELFIKFGKFGMGKPSFDKVVRWRSKPIAQFGDYSIQSEKSKGQVINNTFSFYGGQQWEAIDATCTGPIPNVEEQNRFLEAFKLSVSRYVAAANDVDFTEQIAALGELYKEGVLNEVEFSRAKELFIGRAPDAQRQAEQTLRSLKQLHDTGVLSEAEYSAKKGQILSKS